MLRMLSQCRRLQDHWAGVVAALGVEPALEVAPVEHLRVFGLHLLGVKGALSFLLLNLQAGALLQGER